MTRDDPILGTVRTCPRCHEEWPLDHEFWYWQQKHGRRVLTSWCRACWSEYNAQRRRKVAVA